MTTRELAAKVKLMRIAQATYFRHRDSEALDRRLAPQPTRGLQRD